MGGTETKSLLKQPRENKAICCPLTGSGGQRQSTRLPEALEEAPGNLPLKSMRLFASKSSPARSNYKVAGGVSGGSWGRGETALSPGNLEAEGPQWLSASGSRMHPPWISRHLAELGLLSRPSIKTMAPSQESVTWLEQRHFQPPGLLPESPTGTIHLHWAGWADARTLRKLGMKLKRPEMQLRQQTASS